MAIDFQITISHPGTVSAARGDVRAYLKENLRIINALYPSGKPPGDGSNPYTEADIDTATDDQLRAALEDVLSFVVRSKGTAWKKRAAGRAAEAAEPGSEITQPGGFGS